MSDSERVELRALRADDAARERVVGRAIAEIRGQPRTAPAAPILSGSARYLAPVLAAAAVVALLVVQPSGTSLPEAEVQGAGVLLEAAGTVPDDWLRW